MIFRGRAVIIKKELAACKHEIEREKTLNRSVALNLIL
jgi:hypothetical protein